ncbi:MAG: LLM class flavin-dependent oxidoreductase, partial [bacterium]|nr:LLM class flavin-dependent oxidoreductase [bacterium]
GALFLVRNLRTGQPGDGDGHFYRFGNALSRPAPKPSIPFLVGGRSDAALDRAGRLADGWLAAWCSAKRFKQSVEIVELAGAKRKPRWQHGLQVWIGIGSSPAEGRVYVSEAMLKFYKLRFELFERYSPTGTPHQIAEFLAPYVRAGATALNLTPCGPDRETEIAAAAEIKLLLGG